MADILGPPTEGVTTPPTRKFGRDNRGWFCLERGCSWPGADFTYSSDVAKAHGCTT